MFWAKRSVNSPEAAAHEGAARGPKRNPGRIVAEVRVVAKGGWNEAIYDNLRGGSPRAVRGIS